MIFLVICYCFCFCFFFSIKKYVIIICLLGSLIIGQNFDQNRISNSLLPFVDLKEPGFLRLFFLFQTKNQRIKNYYFFFIKKQKKHHKKSWVNNCIIKLYSCIICMYVCVCVLVFVCMIPPNIIHIILIIINQQL